MRVHISTGQSSLLSVIYGVVVAVVIVAIVVVALVLITRDKKVNSSLGEPNAKSL